MLRDAVTVGSTAIANKQDSKTFILMVETDVAFSRYLWISLVSGLFCGSEPVKDLEIKVSDIGFAFASFSTFSFGHRWFVDRSYHNAEEPK
jgi:hypothetical protein